MISMRRSTAVLPDRQRRPASLGVATLTMVMILFFIMAMVAAYANRNLIYEQRTATNFYREAASMSAAEAGIDWAMTMLSGGRIDTDCKASTSAADGDFRSRYLQLQSDGTYKPVLWSYVVPGVGSTVPRLTPLACVQGAAGWQCSCPSSDLASLPFIDGTAPVLRVEVDSGGRPGVLIVRARGCSNLGNNAGIQANPNQLDACHRASIKYANKQPFVDSVIDLQVSLGLARALPVPPVAALTAGENVTMNGGSALNVSNADPNTGIAVHVGTAINASNKNLGGPAGSSAAATLEGDTELQTLAQLLPSNVMKGKKPLFSSIFGIDPDTFKRQPGARIIDCSAGCTSADIANSLANEPSRIIWIDGDINLDQAGTMGTATQPVMLVAAGKVTLSAAITINGFVFGNMLTWEPGSVGSLINGAAMAYHDVTGNAPVVIAYNADILRTVSNSFGSFVRVPGSWQLTPIQ